MVYSTVTDSPLGKLLIGATEIGLCAVRAVAGACARNSVGIVIPCHRVVRQDGALGGYRWGVARKRKLLAWERAHSQ